MKVFRHCTKSIDGKTPRVVCLGTFDGLHAGHQALIATTLELAKKKNLRPALLTFEPLPWVYFTKQKQQVPTPRLMRFRDKYQLLQAWGMEDMWVLPFDQRMASMSAADFVENVLVEWVGAQAVVVGSDFCFGKDRSGNVETLSELGDQLGFSVSEVLPVLMKDGVRYSSTLLRQALTDGDFVLVESMLDRHYSVSGCVGRGDGRGRQIGFPTANVQISPDFMPLEGVFVVEALRPSGERCRGVANVGQQPTFAGLQKRLEVHLFDFNASLYGERLQVFFYSRIRGVQSFSGVEELVQQINDDVAVGRAWFEEEGKI